MALFSVKVSFYPKSLEQFKLNPQFLKAEKQIEVRRILVTLKPSFKLCLSNYSAICFLSFKNV